MTASMSFPPLLGSTGSGRERGAPPGGWLAGWLYPAFSPDHSASIITVFVPNDVVLAQIRAGLYLDQVQRLVGRILQPVLSAERNESRFVFAHFVNLVVARHACPAGDDDPVLGALVMHLQ